MDVGAVSQGVVNKYHYLEKFTVSQDHWGLKCVFETPTLGAITLAEKTSDIAFALTVGEEKFSFMHSNLTEKNKNYGLTIAPCDLKTCKDVVDEVLL